MDANAVTRPASRGRWRAVDARRRGWVVEVTSWDIHRYAIYRIRNTTADRCLTAPTIGNGTRLVILDCDGAPSQEWRM